MRAWFDALLSVVFAPVCAACERPLEQPLGSAVCGACWASIRPIVPPFCERCGDALPSWRIVSLDLARCARCRRHPSGAVDRARAVGSYDGALRAVIHALKYDARRSLARPLAHLMRSRGASILDGAAAVVPVPLHAARHRQRGFNQAEDLARNLGLDMVAALRRFRPTAIQAELPASQRHSNVKNAFAATAGARVLAGRTVVLVDDVSTTGATLDACAAALKGVGVAEVRALTAARVLSARR